MSSEYLDRIRNETNRVKRRQQQIIEQEKQEQSLNQPSPAPSTPNRGYSATATTIATGYFGANPIQSEHQTARYYPDKDVSYRFEDDDDDPLQLVPPDTRGESTGKIELDSLSHGRARPKYQDPVPRKNMSLHLQEQHEAFRRKLVDDVLGDGASDRVPMEKVVMLIWQYREDPQVVKFMTRFVAKVRP
jgi:hypothetical protein